MQMFGSKRLTQISAVSLLLSDVCEAVIVLCGSVCVCVVFVMSLCVGLAVVFRDVLVSVKMIFGKFDFVVVSVFFLADSTSLASRTDVVEDVSCTSCCGNFVNSDFPFFPFVGGCLCHLGSKRLSSQSNEPCQFCVDSFWLLDSFVLSSGGMNPPLKPLVSVLRLIFDFLLRFIEIMWTEFLQLVWYAFVWYC